MNMNEPLYFEDSDLEKLKDLKTKFVRGQDYETASWLRNVEKVLVDKIDQSKEAKLKLLENKESLTKEQVKSLLDNAVKLHEETIIALKERIVKDEDSIKSLQGTIMQTIDMTQEFGEYLLRFCETYSYPTSLDGITDHKINFVWKFRSDDQSTLYTTEQMYGQFLDWRFDPKNKAAENLDPDNGESLWQLKSEEYD